MSRSGQTCPDKAGREAGCRAGVHEHTEGTVIELPEAVTHASQIERTLGGRRIDEVEVHHSAHAFAGCFGDPAAYPALLTGRSVSGAASWGGMVEIATRDSSPSGPLCPPSISSASGSTSEAAARPPRDCIPARDPEDCGYLTV